MRPEQPTGTDPIATLLATPPDLPVVSGLAELRDLLTGPTPNATGAEPIPSGASAAPSAWPAPSLRSRSGSAVVTAPPGTGKTTLVPPLVADAVSPGGSAGRVIVTQPRRVAARAAARRLADLMGEPVGRAVGYAVRDDRKVSDDTRIEVVTAGLLLRRLQRDPDLPGVAAVVLDEVHERSLDSDLLLALLIDARALREDLTLVAMSATLDLDRLPAMLGATDGEPAPVLDVPSPLHPVEELWSEPPSSAPRLGPRGVPREFLAHVAGTTQRALAEHPGDALVFLPGAREVDDVVARLRSALPASGAAAVDVLPLHGRLPASAQDAALQPSTPGGRRVVVSTNVAESSLTVPGVRIVVDGTLAREPRLDVARGISGLVTVGESRSAGTQRAGRAGREGPGVVVRCCSPVDWARAPQAPTPEILSADLTRTALELAVWGAPDGAGLAWIDEPPAPAMAVARDTLRGLGLLDDAGLTPLGRSVAAVPAQVREARALLAAAESLGARRAAEATALLTADLHAPGSDLTALVGQVRDGGAAAGAWRSEAKRLERALGDAAPSGLGPDGGSTGLPSRALASNAPARTERPSSHRPDGEHRVRSSAGGANASGGRGAGGSHGTPGLATTPFLAEAVGLIAALAHPEWIARRRGPAPAPGEEATYATVGGTGLRLPRGTALAAAEWLAVADVDRAPGRSDALVRAAAPVDEELALAVGAPWLVEEERTRWEGGRVRAERVRALGAITLTATPVGAPSPAAIATAVVDACREQGLDLLPWDGGDHRAPGELRARLALLHAALGEPWPAMNDEALLARADEWLVPAVESAAGRSKRFDLAHLDLLTALRALLPWPEAGRLDELAPERVEVPSGSHVRVDYLDETGEGWRPLDRPVLAVRVQECFGWADTPRLADGRVPVLIHLLSPARRPVAVTDDLRSFWAGPYQDVRKELRGRYPKHAWPEDPWTAPAIRGTKKRAQGRG